MDGLVGKSMSKVSSEYARLMVRDILGMELNDMDISERYRAITYSWLAFNSRSQLFEKEESNPTEGLVISHPSLEVFERETFSPEFLNQIESKVTRGNKT